MRPRYFAVLLSTAISALTPVGPEARGTQAFPLFEAYTGVLVGGENGGHGTFADIDHDDDLDLVGGEDRLGIWLNDGAASFQHFDWIDFDSVGDGVYSGDVNGDGEVDVISYRSITARGSISYHLAVLPGDGNAAFGAAVTTNVAKLNDILVGDWNGDEFADIAATSQDDNGVYVMLGQGTGAFTVPVLVATGPFPRCIRSVDFDLDTDNDLLVSDRDAKTIGLLRNDGNGAFTFSVLLNPTDSPTGFDVAQTDGDLFWDIAVSDTQSATAALFKGQTGETFAAPTDLVLPNGAPGVIFADLHNDGDEDLLFQTHQGFVALFNDGAGGFAMGWRSYAIGQLSSQTLPDLNSDSLPELVFEGGRTGFVAFYLSDADVVYHSESIIDGTDESTVGALTSDLNMDGAADVVVAQQSVFVEIFLSDPGTDDTFILTQRFQAVSGQDYYSANIGEFNGDGIPDLVTTNTFESGQVEVRLGDGLGHFSLLPDRLITGLGFGKSWASDINNDGLDDIVKRRSSLAVCLNLGGTSFAPFVEWTLPSNYDLDWLELAELNGDGFPDFLIPTTDRSELHFELNNAGTGLIHGGTLAHEHGFRNFNAGYFNADEFIDIAYVTNLPGWIDPEQSVGVYLSNSDGTFGASQSLAYLYVGQQIMVDDIDLDGNQDILCGDSGLVRAFLGNGDGTFAANDIIMGSGLDPVNLLPADVDRDGDHDLVVAGGDHQDTVVLENRLLGPDNIPPSTAITTPSGVLSQTSPIISLNWQGSDNQTGIHRVELFYNKDGTGYVSAGQHAMSPIEFDASLTGGEGTYAFYICGIDGARNVEAAPAVADSTIQLILDSSVSGWFLLER